MNGERKRAIQRKILEISLANVWDGEKVELRKMFESLQKQNYGVLGYRYRLELALKYVVRAEAAIKALNLE